MNEDKNGGNEPQAGWQFHDESSMAAASSPAPDTQQPAATQPAPPVPPVSGAESAQQGQQPVPNSQPPTAETQPEVAWQAAEFIVHEKSAGWYMAFLLVAVVIIALVFFVSRDIFSTVTTVAVFIMLGWMAVRRPRDVGYHIGTDGVMVNDHLHPYSTFKSFGMQDEGGVSSLVFMPLKRFMLPLYAYYPPDEEDKIVEALSRHLPFAPTEQSLLERIAHRLKF